MIFRNHPWLETVTRIAGVLSNQRIISDLFQLIFQLPDFTAEKIQSFRVSIFELDIFKCLSHISNRLQYLYFIDR